MSFVVVLFLMAATMLLVTGINKQFIPQDVRFDAAIWLAAPGVYFVWVVGCE